MFNLSQDGHNLFEMTFVNGWKIVVEWGAGVQGNGETAQVKAFTPSNEPFIFEKTEESILGYATADKIVTFMMYIKNMEII